MTTTTLVVFAKAPLLGHVKTRLQPDFDAGQSLAIHRSLVGHTLDIARQLDDVVIELWVSARHEFWQQFDQAGNGSGGIRLYVQQGDSLGERMHKACLHALRRSGRVLVIGSDCPAMTVDYLQRAVQRLQQFPVVLGPAEDGGYVMIAMTDTVADRAAFLFESINWGSSEVLTQTRAALDAQQLARWEMETLWDVDRPEDIARALALANPLAATLAASIEKESGAGNGAPWG